jgi:hypothetical protein
MELPITSLLNSADVESPDFCVSFVTLVLGVVIAVEVGFVVGLTVVEFFDCVVENEVDECVVGMFVDDEPLLYKVVELTADTVVEEIFETGPVEFVDKELLFVLFFPDDGGSFFSPDP